MKISNTSVTFRIDIDFEDSDVDMVYKEARQNGFSGIVPHYLCGVDNHKVQGTKTPSSNSVEFCLSWLRGYVDREEMEVISQRYFSRQEMNTPLTELEKIGIDVESSYGLMQGTCHLMCTVDATLFSKELVEKANKIVYGVFKKYVRYYNQKKVA